ncbi:MAG TPA: primosomal protein N' [Burkholderiales bacterium]|nr:primosomal protein N' [Burkholderiales bacterium]
MAFLRVALDVPLPELFDYAVGDAAFGADGRDCLGRRVIVPFGRKSAVGLVLDVARESAFDPARIKPVREIISDTPPLPPAWLELLRFCAGYYQHPLGAAALAALPAKFKTDQAFDPLLWTRLHWTGAPPDYPKRERVKTMLAATLAQAPQFGCDLAGASPKALHYLAEWRDAGLIAEAAAPALVVADAPQLNSEQAAAAAAVIAALGGNGAGERSAASYAPFLLHGVTGSGKTEVYLHVAAQALQRGRQALILVPEINLTPRLLEHFRTRFPASRVVALHSGLNESERLHNWLLAHTGGADIVLGTRLAILAPMPRLGLIVVDEEHDPSFKQQEGMRYSARDLAVFRAKNEGVPVILGSATPALESYAHAQSGRYTRLRINSRAVPDAALPKVSLIDLNLTPAEHGVAAPVWAALRERLERGEQSLVFLNRRGFAPVLSCPACAWVSACLRCTSYLVLHRGRGMQTGGKLVCHHCGWEEKVPEACPTCGNIDIRAYGQGTQRLESHVAEACPGARVLRIDRDSTSRKGEAEALLNQAHAGEVDILVGTQMLAKGHDFKNLTLVAAVNVDAALFSSDFRAGERLFAQLMQVAGRAGRAEKPGEVLIQTRKPEHPLFQSVIAADYDRFAKTLLAERSAAGLPPAAFQAMLRVEAAKLDVALGFLKAAAESGVDQAGVTLYDPVPMSLTRLMNVERAQLMAESPSRPALQAFLTRWLPWLYANAPRSVRWHVEVDPLEI